MSLARSPEAVCMCPASSALHPTSHLRVVVAAPAIRRSLLPSSLPSSMQSPRTHHFDPSVLNRCGMTENRIEWVDVESGSELER